MNLAMSKTWSTCLSFCFYRIWFLGQTTSRKFIFAYRFQVLKTKEFNQANCLLMMITITENQSIIWWESNQRNSHSDQNEIFYEIRRLDWKRKLFQARYEGNLCTVMWQWCSIIVRFYRKLIVRFNESVEVNTRNSFLFSSLFFYIQ